VSRFHPPWETLKILLNPQAFNLDRPAAAPSSASTPSKHFGKAEGAAFFFWASIVIHLMPIGVVYFTGGMGIALCSILAVNYLLTSYFVGACALGYAPKNAAPESPQNQAFDVRMLLVYSALFVLTGAWPLIYFKLAAAGGVIGMVILPIYLFIGLSTVLHYFYQAPSPDQARNFTMLQHLHGFVAERILPSSLSLHHMVRSRIDNAVLEVKNRQDADSSDETSSTIPIATLVPPPNAPSSLNPSPPEGP
jgi:hypothetical protein